MNKKLIAIIGPAGSGKTTTANKLSQYLKLNGISVGGITQPAIREGQQCLGYELRDEATGERCSLAYHKKRSTPLDLGFRFEEHAWEWARERIKLARSNKEVFILDELGLLEAEGKGHWPALVEAVTVEHAKIYILAIRFDCADYLQQQLGTFHFTYHVPLLPAQEQPSFHHILQLISETYSPPIIHRLARIIHEGSS